MGSGNHSCIVRFGPFEADLVTAELRKEGARLALQVQPFQVLALLLKQPGELVTRERFRTQSWAQDTFVVFDHPLNPAIKKTRVALEDDAEPPKYIETPPRGGYLFIPPVKPPPIEAPDSGIAHATRRKI